MSRAPKRNQKRVKIRGQRRTYTWSGGINRARASNDTARCTRAPEALLVSRAGLAVKSRARIALLGRLGVNGAGLLDCGTNRSILCALAELAGLGLVDGESKALLAVSITAAWVLFSLAFLDRRSLDSGARIGALSARSLTVLLTPGAVSIKADAALSVLAALLGGRACVIDLGLSRTLGLPVQKVNEAPGQTI